MKKIFFSFVCVVALLVGCSKDPLQKLASDIKYPDMTKEFWQKEYSNKTELWQKGLEYCKQNYRLLTNGSVLKPNCEPVMNIDFGQMFNNSDSNITGKLNEHPLHNSVVP